MLRFCPSPQLVFFNLPLTGYLCWSLLHRCLGHSFRSHLCQGRAWRVVPVHLCMLLVYLWQMYACVFLHLTYGTVAFLLSPLRTWLVVLSPILVRCVWTRPPAELGPFLGRFKSPPSS